jgi:hypothetical protein
MLILRMNSECHDKSILGLAIHREGRSPPQAGEADTMMKMRERSAS